jgi:hypothetical protein
MSPGLRTSTLVVVRLEATRRRSGSEQLGVDRLDHVTDVFDERTEKPDRFTVSAQRIIDAGSQHDAWVHGGAWRDAFQGGADQNLPGGQLGVWERLDLADVDLLAVDQHSAQS